MHEPNSAQPKRVLSIFVLAMLNVSIMASLRNLPLVAEYGLSAIFYFIIVAILFLIPSALVSAELATGWPKAGGVYIWVREALGDRWGFFSIWMQWVHNVAWYPVILSFVATTFAYVINPKLVEHKIYVTLVILFCFWGMTLINYLGVKISSWFSAIGVILGTIIPGILIIGFGVTWLSEGHPSQIALTYENIVPNFKSIGSLAFLAGLFLSFVGLEVSAAHAGDVVNPQKNFPRSIIIAALITFFVFMLGALSIAVVIPTKEISLVTGLMNAFEYFFSFYEVPWILPLMAILLIIGAIAEVNAWIGGPVKGLYATVLHGNLPPLFHRLNRHGMPTNLLLFQAIIVTVSSLVFLFMPSVSSSFWILSVLSAQSYLLMYILMFIAAIRLRYIKPQVPRSYRVPFQIPGIWVFSLIGIISSLFAIIIGYVPPEQIQVGSLSFYEGFLIFGILIMAGIPLLIFQFRKPHWFITGKSGIT